METKIVLENGKYTVRHDNGVGLRAERYGEPWRSLTGDGLVLALAQRIEDLELALRTIAAIAPPMLEINRLAREALRG